MRMISRIAIRFRKGDHGSSLMAVIGVMAVTAIVGVTVGTVAAGALSVTAGTRSTVQARAAAEAGLDTTVAGIKAGTCAANLGAYASTADPVFTTAVYYQTTVGETWATGCPSATAARVKILATGWTGDAARLAAAHGQSHTLEAVYLYTAATPGNPGSASITANGSAIYTYSSGQLNDADIYKDTQVAANVQIKTGNVGCQSNTVIQGSLSLGAGNVNVEADCQILGSVAVSGKADIRGNVTGDVSASGVGVPASEYAFSVQKNWSNAGYGVGGNVYVGGRASLAGKVTGSVTASGTGTTLVNPNDAKVAGNLAIAGTIDTWVVCNNDWNSQAAKACGIKNAGAVSGTVTYQVAGLTPPAVPNVPNWVDFAFVASDWTSAGYTVVTWPNNSDYCTIDNRTSLMSHATALSSYTSPVVIDARACNRLTFSSSANLNLSLKTDIAFIAKGINIESLTANSSTSTQRQLRFIVPDLTDNDAPTCVSGGGVDVNSVVAIGATVSALIYTPCIASNSDNNWRGQMYAGVVQFNSNSGMYFKPVGLPGIDLDTGNTAPSGGVGATPATPGGLGALEFVRDVAS